MIKPNKASLILIFLSLYIFAFASASMPEPTTINQGSWEVEYSTDTDFFSHFEEPNSPNTYACLLSKTATKANELPELKKNYYLHNGTDWVYEGFLNDQPYTINDVRYYGWCRNIDTSTIDRVKLGDESTVWEWVNETWLIYDTDTYEKKGFTVKVPGHDVYWIEKDGTSKFFFNETINDTDPLVNVVIEVWDDENILDFDTENEIIHQRIEYTPFFNLATGQTELKRINNPLYLDLTDLFDSPLNNLSREDSRIIGHQYKDRFESWAFCLAELSWSGYVNCLNDYEYFTIELSGTINDTDPALNYLFNTTNDLGIDWQTNQTNITNLGLSLEINSSTDFNKTPYYIYDTGNFTSLVFHNDTSTYWNVTQNIADSDGSAEVYDLCQTDNNCVSYWDLDSKNLNTNPYNDEKGSNDGTPTGTNNATGISSGAMRFDGVDDYINTGNDASLQIVSNLSVFGWIKSDDLGLNTLASKYDFGDNNRAWLIYTDALGGGKIRVILSDDGTSASGHLKTYISSIAVYDNNWHQVGFTFNSGELKLYIDGVEDTNVDKIQDSSFSQIYNSNQDVTIGTLWDTTSIYAPFNGSIDEVLIYNGSLTSSEVEALYKAGLSQHADTNVSLWTRTADSYNVSDSGLFAFWSFNGDANDELGDYNLTVSGATYGEDYGTVGGGYSFVTSDRLTSTALDSLDTQMQSMSLWVYPTVNKADEQVLIGWSRRNQYLHQYSTVLYLQDGNLIASGDDGDNHGHLNCSLELNTWQYIAANFDATGELYVDGQLCDSGEDLSGRFVYGFSIGVDDQDLDDYYDGYMDEVRLYNRTLSASEIQNLYELGSAHIEWNDWEEVGVKEDGVPKTSLSAGKFMQFKDSFTTNDTDVSAYVLNYSVGPGEEPITNVAPNDPTPVLQSKDFLNSTMADLNCSSIISDPDGDNMNLTVYWYKDDVLNLTNNYLNLPNAINFMDNLSVTNLTIGDIWKCGMILTNGSLTSNQVNSTALTIIKQNTSLLGVRFDLPEFTFDSTDYVNDGSFSFNTSIIDVPFVIMTSFNIKNAVGGTGNVEVWGRVKVDGTIVKEQKLETLSWLGGETVIKSTGFEYINFTIPNPGIHNVTFSFKQVSVNSKPVTIYNEDISMGQLLTNESNVVNGSLSNMNTTFSSTTPVKIFNKSIDRIFPGPDYHTTTLTLTANQTTTAYCRFRDTLQEDYSPWLARYISSSTDIGTASITWVDFDELQSHNTSLECYTSNGALVRATGEIVQFSLRDIGGYYISANQSTNTYTNISSVLNLTTGNYTLTSHQLEFKDAGDSSFVSAMVSFKSLSGIQTPKISVNSTIGSGCYSEKQRYLADNNDIANAFIYVICKDSPVKGQKYNMTLKVEVPAGETLQILDESLTSFEIQSFDTLTLNTRPIVTILTPETGESVYATYNVTWEVTDFQSDSFLQNITLYNSTGAYPVATGLDNNTFNYLLDTTAYENGDYNLTISVCENLTSELLCGNSTTQMMINQIPIVNITYPVNGAIYTSLIDELNYTETSASPDMCWYSLNDGATNSTPITAGENFTGVPFVEGTNTPIVYCNNTYSNVGSDTVTFTIDLPPVINTIGTSPADGSVQNVVFPVTVNATDTQGVDTIYYSINGGENKTWTMSVNEYLNSGTHTITFWVNDTYGSITTQTNTFRTTGEADLICDTNEVEFGGRCLNKYDVINSDYTPQPISLTQGWNAFGILPNSTYQTTGDFSLQLYEGSNLVGYSALGQYNLTDLMFDNGTANYTYEQALSNGLVDYVRSIDYNDRENVGGNRDRTQFYSKDAYWIKMREDGIMWVDDITYGNTGLNFHIDDFTFVYEKERKTLAEAVTAGWIEGTSENDAIHFYNTTAPTINRWLTLKRGTWNPFLKKYVGQVNATTWVGYFIQSYKDNVQIIIHETKDVYTPQECTAGYVQNGFYNNGTIKCVEDQTGGESGSTTATVQECAYKRYGFYNTKLPWFRDTGCT